MFEKEQSDGREPLQAACMDLAAGVLGGVLDLGVYRLEAGWDCWLFNIVGWIFQDGTEGFMDAADLVDGGNGPR